MNDGGIKVRVFDIDHGLTEYENVKTVKIVSKDDDFKVIDFNRLVKK